MNSRHIADGRMDPSGCAYSRTFHALPYLEVVSFHVLVSPDACLCFAAAGFSHCPAIAFATVLRAGIVNDSREACDCSKDSRAEKTRRPVRPCEFLYLAQ